LKLIMAPDARIEAWRQVLARTLSEL